MLFVLQVLMVLGMIVLTGLTYRMIFATRKEINCSLAMMAAMIGGSMTGLITGTMLALYQGFFMNSLLAMVIGIGAGVVIGLPFNVMAMLDGIMAGVMGGLMGAMMGDMLESAYIIPLALVFLLIYGLCVVLLNRAIRQINKEEQEKLPDAEHVKKWSVLTTYVTVVLFAMILVFSFYEESKRFPAPEVHYSHHQHSSHNH